VFFDEIGLIKGVFFDEIGLIKGVFFDEIGLIKGVFFDEIGLIRWRLNCTSNFLPIFLNTCILHYGILKIFFDLELNLSGQGQT
jgi:hypothetical protein